MKKLTLFIASILLIHCAGDIKGEAGIDGQDALSNPLIRIPRPSFYSLTSTVVAVDATTDNPALFKFGSEILTAEDTLLCDLTKSGPGGLWEWLTQASETVYYLYGIKNGSTVALLTDTNPPTSGPEDITDWTYLGAFPSKSFLPDYTSSDGFLSSSAIGSGFLVNWVPILTPKTIYAYVTTATVDEVNL